MEPNLRQGHVLWYDAVRGYGFVHDEQEAHAIFITKTSLEEFGVTRLHAGVEIVFDVIKGRASKRVNSIVLLGEADSIH